ncbi:MAG TPA: hypothetical protein VK689_18580, partial [Armatimonadota bacterium]|nr:hypothetical protein [Armatimonadota bacterium]
MSDERSNEGAPARTGAGAKAEHPPSPARTLAEWVSLGISILLIVALAGYLLRAAARGDDPYVPTEVRPLLDQARQVGGAFILPVEIANQ